jgi:type IV fimbrial biogenesis protein FimT
VLNTFPKTRSFGFSLIELMFGIAIVAILATVAVPSFRTWIQNIQIRTATESITNGLQRARAEAVARNTNVDFVLGTGSSWTVDYVVKPVSTDPAIDSRSSTEGSVNVTRTVVPVGATTITFNNLGTVGVPPNQPLNADGTAPFTQIDLAAVGANQNLRVTIGVGGNARTCDPNLAAGTSPRAC